MSQNVEILHYFLDPPPQDNVDFFKGLSEFVTFTKSLELDSPLTLYAQGGGGQSAWISFFLRLLFFLVGNMPLR